MAPMADGGGAEASETDTARSRLHELLVEHLATEGVDGRLLSELRAALTTGRRSAARGDSELLRDFARWHGGGGAAPRAARWAAPRGDGAPRGGGGGGAAAAVAEATAATTSAASPKAEAPRKGRAASAGPCCGLGPVSIVLLLSLLFLPCVVYSEWYIDELFAAVRNADARGETPLRDVFAHDFWGNSLWDGGWTHKSYRPLVVLSYAYQYQFNNGIFKPQPLRAFNVALHSANSVLLYFVLRRFRLGWRWACLAAGLFATHPAHCENVIYLVGRADAMATQCWLLALLTWPMPQASRSPRRCSRILRVLFATVLAVVGGLCKEIGFCVIAQLAVLELLGPWPVSGAAPLLAIFGAVFLGRNWFTDGTKAGFSYVDTPVQYHSNVWVRFCTYLYFHAKYAQLMVFPWTLCWDYSYNALPVLEATFADVRFLAVVTAYLAVVAFASWGFAKRNRLAVFGLSDIIIPFIPASNLFFVVGVTVGERLLYPCNVGAAMVVAAMGGRKRRGRHVSVLGLLLLAVFLYRGGYRVWQWSNRDRLFGPDADSYPMSMKARHQYGTVLHREGRFDEALVHFQAALKVFNQSALTEYCIAQIYIETGRPLEAKASLERIFAGHGMGFGRFNLYALYIDYAFALMMNREYDQAVPHFLQGLGMNEDVPHGLNALGYTYVQLGRMQEAAEAFQKGLRYDPTNPYLLNNVGVSLLTGGQLEAGVEHLSRAVQLEPNVPAFVYNVRLVQQMAEMNRWPSDKFVLELYYNRGN